MSTPEEAIQKTIQEIEVEYRQSFADATTVEELEVAKAGALGKMSKYNSALQMLGGLPSNIRAVMGERLNDLQRSILRDYQIRENEIHALRDADLSVEEQVEISPPHA